MSDTIFLPPPPRTPLALALQQRKTRPQVRLLDFPALALAATATTAELEPDGAAFAGVYATLETLNRLRLSATSARLLMLLVTRGTLSATELANEMKVTTASITGLIRRLAELALVGLQRPDGDRRVVLITATDAARRVLASIVALTALGQAASVLLRKAES